MRKLIITLALAAPLGAQGPAIRLLAAPDAQSKPIFGTVPAVRQLPGGKLLVNDVQKRQLTLLDPALANPAIVADSSAGATNSYGLRGGSVIGYLGDSTLFVDPSGPSMFVIDPAGKIARVASVPRPQDAQMIGNPLGNSGVDAKGRLVYRAGITFFRAPPAPGAAGNAGGRGAGGPGLGFPEMPDSSAIVRYDAVSRKLDTAAVFKILKNKMIMTPNDRGGYTGTSETNPLPQVDEWATLADGSIAIVRGIDYHVDFVNADGSVSAGAKIPFDWQRLSDDDKVAVIDSAKKAVEAQRAAAANAPPGSPPAGGGDGGGLPRMIMNVQVGDGGAGGGGGGAQRILAGGGLPGPGLGNLTFIAAADLPDYRPAFTLGAARGDADGNLWVRTTAVRPGSAGQVYDVINRRGELIDRVQIPAGRQIVGFGKGGVVYMLARDPAGNWLERSHR